MKSGVRMPSIREIGYERLLERAYQKLPKRGTRAERFQIPKAQVMIIGDKTIIRNFKEIADILNRDVKILQKWYAKELAIPVQYDEKSGQLILVGRFSSQVIQTLLERFVKQYVICPTCGGPDTELIRVDRKVWILKCHVCGAETPVPGF